MKMKATASFLVSLLWLAGCQIDNYELPQASLSGRIVDSQTNKLVESGGINAGTVVRLYEGEGKQPLIYNTKPDGTFTNSKVFAGSYTYTAQGPFSLASNALQQIQIQGDTELEIKVIPNVRLQATVEEVQGTTARVKVRYEKLAADQKLVHLGLVWSTFPNPNNATFTGGNIKLEEVESQDLSSGETTFLITDLGPGTRYYVRASARTANPGNYYNYSTQLEVKAP